MAQILREFNSWRAYKGIWGKSVFRKKANGVTATAVAPILSYDPPRKINLFTDGISRIELIVPTLFFQ